MNLFETSLRFNGFPIAAAKQHLLKIQQIPDAEYKNYAIEQRWKVVMHHLKENSFYQEFLKNKSLTHWEDVPVMHKSDLQRPIQQRLSNGFTPKNCYVNKTSGSSGHPFIFAKDKFCHALTWAENIDRFGWHGIDFNRSLQARFYGIPLDFYGNTKERFKDVLSHRHRFPIFDLSEEKMEGFLKVFQHKKFEYINGYTSSIVLFAKYLQKRGIVLKNCCPSLKLCIVTSEMLYETDKILLENTLGVPVINEYGASELDVIAFTNPQNEFVVNSETLFVEILDENEKAVSNGVSGRIVITSLYNKAHPFIRYDIGDTGILDEKSTFKKPLLKQLLGRTNDVATLPSGKIVPGLTFYYVTKSVIEDDGNVKEFVIEQRSFGEFKINYVSEKALSRQDEEKIKKGMQTYLEENLTLTFERFPFLDRSKRGKLKQFVSEIEK